MQDLKVIKSNSLNEASYKLSLQEQKLVLACIAKIRARKENEVPKTMTLTAIEFSELMMIDASNSYRELCKAADKLYDQSIEIRRPDQIEKFRWIQKQIQYHKGEGRISITWSDEVLNYLGYQAGRYTEYKLRHIAHLQSIYAIRIYELLIQFKATKERVIHLDDFRSILKLEKKYLQFKELNKSVIKPAVEELNQRSDLVITYETIKQGRNVVALAFEFKQNAQMKLDL